MDRAARLVESTYRRLPATLRHFALGSLLGGLERVVGKQRVWALINGSARSQRSVEDPFVLTRLGRPADDNRRLLEVGCVNSPFSYMLPEAGFELTGIDLRPWRAVHPRFQFVQGDFVLKADLPGAPFDVIYSISVLEHVAMGGYGNDASLTESAERDFARRARHLLRGGGRLILTVPCGKEGVGCVGLPEAYRVYPPGWIERVICDAGFQLREAAYWRITNNAYWDLVGPHEVVAEAFGLGCFEFVT